MILIETGRKQEGEEILQALIGRLERELRSHTIDAGNCSVLERAAHHMGRTTLVQAAAARRDVLRPNAPERPWEEELLAAVRTPAALVTI